MQHAGVDEGGIVKLHGDHFVILRRGRVFTVSLDLKPVSAVDAYGPDVDPRGAWYDELLISEHTIAVIGYSYARGGTEIGLFDLSRSGELTYKVDWYGNSRPLFLRNRVFARMGYELVEGRVAGERIVETPAREFRASA